MKFIGAAALATRQRRERSTGHSTGMKRLLLSSAFNPRNEWLWNDRFWREAVVGARSLVTKRSYFPIELNIAEIVEM
jgi:hypothetical protein